MRGIERAVQRKVLLVPFVVLAACGAPDAGTEDEHALGIVAEPCAPAIDIDDRWWPSTMPPAAGPAPFGPPPPPGWVDSRPAAPPTAMYGPYGRVDLGAGLLPPAR
jgi:hypothetical protein